MDNRNLYIQMMSTYVPAWGFGGPIRIMFDYAKWMTKNLKVSVYTGDVNHDFSKIEVKNENINGIDLKRFKIFLKMFVRKNINFISPLLLYHVVKSLTHTKQKVIIHICELRGTIPLYALFIKVLFKKKVILIHSAFGMLHYKSSIFRRIYDFLFMKSFLKCNSLCLAQNNHEIDSYNKLALTYKLGKKPEVTLMPLHLPERPSVHNLFLSDTKSEETIRSLREKYHIPQDAAVFMFLGRLHPQKGIKRIMDCFLYFLRKYSGNSFLLIVGRDDGFQKEVEKYIIDQKMQSRIKIINNVYEKRFDYYYLTDLFLGFPTIFEETMLASIEAMSCATPILVSREADIPYVMDASAGFVIDYDLEVAIEKMDYILKRLVYFQKNALRVSKEKFSSAIAENKLKFVIDKLING